MKKIFACLFILLLCRTAFCAGVNRIELADGSVINAQVLSFDNGSYTLDAGSLGIIRVDALKIRRIDSGNQNTPPEENTSNLSNTDIKSQMDKVKSKMMTDPETLKMASELTTDPQFQEIMKDPEIVKAVYSGNIQALMSNQKFMAAINHPKIKEIEDKLRE